MIVAIFQSADGFTLENMQYPYPLTVVFCLNPTPLMNIPVAASHRS